MTAEDGNRLPPTLWGTVYWTDHVIAVVDEHAEAEKAVEALRAAGFPAETSAWTGERVTKTHAEYLERRNPLQRLGSALPSEEGTVQDDLVEEAGKGHSILTVPAASDEQAEKARDILRAHGAHYIRHYRANTIVEL